MDFEDPRESKTLCPLDGHRLGPEEASCFNYDWWTSTDNG